MKKRVLAMAMTLAMALSLLPVSALAGEETGDTGVDCTDPKCSHVAEMGGKHYQTLQAAIDAIETSGEIDLLDNISGTQISAKNQMQFLSADKNIVIDLNEKTVTASADEAINIDAANVTLTVKNGKIINRLETGYYSDGVYAYKNSNNLDLRLENIEFGTRTQTIAVQGLTSNSNVTLEGCNITSDVLGIYYPPKSGTLSIIDTSITAPTGITVKGSNVEVSGNSVITANGKKVDPDEYYHGSTDPDSSDSLTLTGNAIYVESGYNDRDITLTITDGKFISKNNNAVQMYIKEDEVTSVKREVTITGGTFSSNVSEYVPENFECVDNEDGTYTVKELDGKLAVNTTNTNDSVSGTLEGTFIPGADMNIDSGSEGSQVNGNDVVVDLATGGGTDKTVTTLTVTETTAGSLSKANSLTVKTDVADVTLDSDALTEVSKANSQVSIKVEKVTAASTEAAAYTVTVQDGGDNNLLPYGEDAGWVTISVPAGKLGEAANSLDQIEAWYVTGDTDNRVYLEELDITNREDGITYRMNHLSTSVLTATTPKTAEAIVTDKDGDVTGYNTISEAISKAVDGDKITLQRNASTNTSFDIGKDITLNLGGHELTVGNGKGVIYVKDGDLSIQNGTVKGLVEVRTSGTDAKYNHLTVGKDVVIDAPSYYALILRESSVGTHSDSYGSTIDVYGRLYGDVWVQGNITTDLAQATHPCVITIHDGAVIDATELDENLGIAVNGAAKVIVNGGTIRGETGIEVRAGQLEVNGGTITGTGTPTTVTPNGNGSTSTGVGIAVAQHTTGLPISVTIQGGNISGYSAFYEQNTQESTDEELKKITINIEDGEFEATNGGTQVVYSENFTGFVDGGSFSDSVKPEYLDSTLNTVLKKASGDTPYSYYHSYADATKDAGPGDTITAVNQQGGTYWTVTFRYNDGVSADTTAEVKDGETVSMPSNPRRSGYTFNGWYNGSTYVGKAGATTEIKAHTVFTASWTKNYDPDDRPSSGSGDGPSGDYIVNVDRTSGGTVTVNPGRADRGDTVTVTVRPKDGYVLDELTVTDSRGNEVELDAVSDTRFTFEMPSGTVRVKADFVRAGQTTQPETPVSGMPYTDVARDAWYFNAVRYAYEKGLMTGVSDTQFGPNVTLTRAQLVQILYALEGKPAVTASAGYADVNAGDWYADAVNWAAANSVVSGVGDNRFAPNDALTREQLSVILYSYTRFKGYDATQGGMAVREYDDYSSISPWAAQGVEWAVNAGLISSVGENLLSPAGTATRAQAAQVLMNFCETVAQ